MTGTLERFSAGESFAVDPEAMERELASLWRQAGASTDGRRPVMRACLWNLIALSTPLQSAEARAALDRRVQDLPRLLAARALVFRVEPRVEGGPELESWISANCILGEGGGKLVCSEELTVVAHDEGQRHLPGLARALRVPELPTAVVVPGSPSDTDTLLLDILHDVDRLVVDLDADGASVHEKELIALGARVPLGVVDLGWIAGAPLRELIAVLFDPPADGALVARIDRVRLGRLPGARRLAAWIASALGARSMGPSTPERLAFVLADGRTLEAELTADEPLVSLLGPDGLRFAVVPAGDGRVALSAPGFEVVRPLSVIGETEQLARALGTRREDQGLARALALLGTAP